MFTWVVPRTKTRLSVSDRSSAVAVAGPQLSVADPGLSEGGFVLGKDIERPKSSTEIGCGGIPSPPH